jgi:Zn-dependent protease with chaperone function
MTAPDFQTLAQIFTGRLLNTAVEGMALSAFAGLLLRLFGRQNSGTRFAVWFSALVAIVALPFFAGSGLLASHLPALPPGNLRGEITLPGSWAFCLFAVWAVVAGVLLLRLGVGLWRVRTLRGNCVDVDLTNFDPAIAASLRQLGSRRGVKLCASDDVTVPAAIGFFRPAIVFPAWLLPQLSAEEFKVIVLHELAHLGRWDDWTNLAQKIVKAVLFFHPAVWWIENRLTLEREMACDDMVLAQTASPKAYAACLISFAEKLQNARGMALAQAIVSRMREMSLRVTQILDATRSSRTGLWKPMLAVSAGMLALAFVTAPYAPQLVGFENPPQQDQAKQHPIQIAKHNPNPAPEERNTLAPDVSPESKWNRMTRPKGATIVLTHMPVGLNATSPRKPAVVRASGAQDQLRSRETFLILQTTQYDASGSAVWTLCIWRIEEGNAAQKQLETIVMSSI